MKPNATDMMPSGVPKVALPGAKCFLFGVPTIVLSGAKCYWYGVKSSAFGRLGFRQKSTDRTDNKALRWEGTMKSNPKL